MLITFDGFDLDFQHPVRAAKNFFKSYRLENIIVHGRSLLMPHDFTFCQREKHSLISIKRRSRLFDNDSTEKEFKLQTSYHMAPRMLS